MKVVCKSKNGYYLTPGKIYDVRKIVNPSISEFTGEPIFEYKVTNDIGIEHYIESNIFITLSKMRVIN